MLGCGAFSSVAPSLIIRNRWPSGDTSYMRKVNGMAYFVSNTLAGSTNGEGHDALRLEL